jgi:hypothetical protein
MRPFAFAAAQLNVVLHDGAPIPAIELGGSAAAGVAAAAEDAERAGGAAVDDGNNVVGGEVLRGAADLAPGPHQHRI